MLNLLLHKFIKKAFMITALQDKIFKISFDMHYFQAEGWSETMGLKSKIVGVKEKLLTSTGVDKQRVHNTTFFYI
jgi:hypothetical protein